MEVYKHIYFENYLPVYGIQFTLDISDLSGSNLQDIEFYSSAGGRGEENGWTFSINNQGMLIGLSQYLGTPLLPGEGLLTVVEWNGNTISNLSGEIGIVDSEVSGYFGSTLSNEIGPDINLDQNLSVRKEKESLKRKLKLNNPYPNPFNPTTKIDYGLPEEANVSLVIFDILGREVITLVNGLQEPGYRSMTWNGTDAFTVIMAIKKDSHTSGSGYGDSFFVHNVNSANTNANSSWSIGPFGDHTWGGQYGEMWGGIRDDYGGLESMFSYPWRGLFMVRMDANYDFGEISVPRALDKGGGC